MKTGWKTHAIGRHLVDLPGDAKTIESYSYNEDKIEPLPAIKNRASHDLVVSDKEADLRAAKHKTRSSMFVERANHPNGSVTLVSWEDASWEGMYHFDTYFRAGSKSLKYSNEVSLSRKKVILDLYHELRGCENIARPSFESTQGVAYLFPRQNKSNAARFEGVAT